MPTGIYKRKPFTEEHRRKMSKSIMEKGCIHYKHGESKPRTRLYSIWRGMKSRCCDFKNNQYKNYGAKGITVCPEWQDKEKGFINFRDWAKSHGYTDNSVIHRKKNHLGYSPDNCEWRDRRKHDKWHGNFRALKIRSKKFLKEDA